MFSRGGFDARKKRRRFPGTHTALEAFAGLAGGDPDKTLVLSYVGQLAADGFAILKLLDNGEIEARLVSGETYLLSQTTILRLA